MKVTFQPEIQALRAIAVLSVLIFHINEKWFPGGFIGVDIFFVISGYLMAAITIRQPQQTAWQFLKRRARRIFPAYYTMLLACLVVGVAIMPSETFYQFSKTVGKAGLFVSNYDLIGATAYFDVGTQFKPLTHTWSLSAEMQFYLLFSLGILLFGVGSFRCPRLILLMVSVACFSLVYSLHYSLQAYGTADNGLSSSTAYYSFISRIWEFLVGMGAAMIKTRFSDWQKTSLSVLGAAALATGLVTISGTSAFPAPAAILPVVGTALLLLGAGGKSIIHQALQGKLLIAIGGYSYSLYLWHWPVLSFWRYVKGSVELILPEIAICMLLTVLLTVWSFHCIEQRVSGRTFARRVSMAYFGLLFLSLASRGLGDFYDTDGKDRVKYKPLCVNSGQGCVPGDDGAPRFLLIGDSHAAHIAGGLIKAIKELDFGSLKVKIEQGCVLVPSQKTYPEKDSHCVQLRQYLTDHAHEFDSIFIASRWESFEQSNIVTNNLKTLLAQLAEDSRTVFVTSQVPSFHRDYSRLAFIAERYRIPMKLPPLPTGSYTAANRWLAHTVAELNLPNVSYLDTTQPFCESESGLCSGYLQGQFAYVDLNHISITASRKLSTVFVKHLTTLKLAKAD